MEKNKLIDRYMPGYTFNEYHETIVNTAIETVYHTAKDIDLSKSAAIRVLFRLRGLPKKRLHLQDFIDDIGFTSLEENVPYENLIGFWTRMKIARIPSYADFKNNSISPWIKVVWNFEFEKIEDNRTKVSTETRVLCVKPITRFTFGLYCYLIKPFSGLVRKKMLRIIKETSESLEKTG